MTDPNARFAARAAALREWLGVEWGVDVIWTIVPKFKPRANGIVFRGPALDALANHASSQILSRYTNFATEEGRSAAASDFELSQMLSQLEETARDDCN